MKWSMDGSECDRLEPQLSAYLDGELEISASCQVMRHLETCSGCTAKVNEFRRIGEALRSLAPPEPPPHLALRLRVAASREARSSQQLELFKMRVTALIRTMTVPVAVGLCAAALAFGGFFGNLGAVLAANTTEPDVALAMASPPRLVQAAANMDVDAAVLVEAQVDATGRVYGYRLISGPRDGALIARLNNQLLFSVFQPATTALGRPTSGSVLVSYGTVHVRG